MASFISRLGRKVLSAIGLTDSQKQIFQILYDRYRIYGALFFPKDARRHLEVLRKLISNKNKKYRSYKFAQIGDFTQMKNARITMGFYDTRLILGKFCSIGENVSYMLGSEHETSFISTIAYGALQGFADIRNPPPPPHTLWV